MTLTKTYILQDTNGNEYVFRFHDDGDFSISQGDTMVAVDPEELDAFMRQLNRFVEKERKAVKA